MQTINEYKQKMESLQLKEKFERMYHYSEVEKRTLIDEIVNLDNKIKRFKFELIKRTQKHDK